VKRGDVVVVALPGDLGKPRPAVILQSDDHSYTTGVTVVPITSHVSEATLTRITLFPNPVNGLREPSQLMVDKITTIPRTKIGQVIGALDGPRMQQLGAHLAVLLGIA
jgi:mRNA interferase MazF